MGTGRSSLCWALGPCVHFTFVTFQSTESVTCVLQVKNLSSGKSWLTPGVALGLGLGAPVSTSTLSLLGL